MTRSRFALAGAPAESTVAGHGHVRLASAMPVAPDVAATARADLRRDRVLRGRWGTLRLDAGLVVRDVQSAVAVVGWALAQP